VNISRAVTGFDDGGVGEIGVDAPHFGELLGHTFDDPGPRRTCRR
jgi:hypothetical protein